MTFDGFAGTRTDSFPSLDLANGAPTGADATNTLVLSWPDAANGLNHETALIQTSTDRGVTWSTPVNGAMAWRLCDSTSESRKRSRDSGESQIEMPTTSLPSAE